MLITTDQFQRLFPNNREAAEWVAAINAILPNYAIDTPVRLAQFLAQAGHESDGFTDLTENLNYSAQALAATWPNRYAMDPKAKVKAPNALALRLHRQPEAIANNCYADRMGNGDEASGDGWRYRGYGPFQITGKSNRWAFARSIGRTPAAAEEYILTKEGGIESACWYWTSRDLNPLADVENTLLITKRINGGTIGLADREARYVAAKTILAA